MITRWRHRVNTSPVIREILYPEIRKLMIPRMTRGHLSGDPRQCTWDGLREGSSIAKAFAPCVITLQEKARSIHLEYDDRLWFWSFLKSVFSQEDLTFVKPSYVDLTKVADSKHRRLGKLKDPSKETSDSAHSFFFGGLNKKTYAPVSCAKSTQHCHWIVNRATLTEESVARYIAKWYPVSLQQAASIAVSILQEIGNGRPPQDACFILAERLGAKFTSKSDRINPHNFTKFVSTAIKNKEDRKKKDLVQ